MSSNNKGLSIIELLVVIAIIVGSLGALLAFVSLSLRTSSLLQQTTRAAFLAQDVMEATKNFRDGIDWDNDDPGNEYDGLGVMETGVSYYIRLSGDPLAKWQLVQGQEIVDLFTREIVFEDVQRDGANNIVESGGSLDSNTKKVTITISWEERGSVHDLEVVSYLTNWK